jgi:hypothetical protein
MVRYSGHVTLSGLPMLVFGSISLGLYMWCGIVNFFRGLGKFGAVGKRLE